MDIISLLFVIAISVLVGIIIGIECSSGDEIIEVVNPKSGRVLRINKTKGIILDDGNDV
jgi:hypothetical protein